MRFLVRVAIACGYGRVTIPLAQAGYHIAGIDLEPDLIREARKQAKAQTLDISFQVGNMIKLPYSDNTFDAIICLWSSFNELLQPTDQIKALEEMVRITKTGGLILIDLPIAEKSGIRTEIISELKHTTYLHDQKTITDRLQRANIKKFIIARKTIGGRKRLIITIHT